MHKSKSLFFWVVLGILGIAIFILFYSYAFPVASVDIKITRKQAIEKCSNFIRAQGFNPDSFDKAIKFSSDYSASVYLQKTQGVKKSNELIGDGMPIWFWEIRFFKELKKEGFVVSIDPSSGKVMRFYHFVLEEAMGASLSQKKAQRIAQEKIKLQGITLDDYELKDFSKQEQANRVDYNFIWEKKDFSVSEAKLRVEASIYGDQLGVYRQYLKLPEGFIRELQGELSFGDMLATAATVMKNVLIVMAVFPLIFKARRAKCNLKFWLICGCLVAVLKIFNFFNYTPLIWSYYNDTTFKAVYFMSAFWSELKGAISSGLIIFAAGMLTQLYLSDFINARMPVFNAFRHRDISIKSILPTFIVGYSLAFIFLGYITIFYMVGTKFFDIWISPDAEYSNVLGMVFPFLFPLTIAVSAAIREEFVYRLFSISFLQKYVKKYWIAIFIPALLWGFAHSFYHIFPTYIRGIELTLFGIVLGIVFLKYGLSSVVIAHFVINAILAGRPLLQSSSIYFVISGIIVVALAFVPLIIFPILKQKLRRLN